MATDNAVRDLNTLAAATSAPPLTDFIMVYPAAGFSPPGTPDATANTAADNNPQMPTSLSLIRDALATTFLALTDTPSSFGTAGQILAVNSARNSLEFINAPSGGGSAETGATIVSKLQALSGAARLSYTALKDTPTIPAVLTGANIVTLLQALTGNARLDASAIRNLPQPQGGGLASINSDDTLSGLGTTASPLSVAIPLTTSLLAKLNGIETGATADQSASEIVTALEALTGNARLSYTALDGVPLAPTVGSIGDLIGAERAKGLLTSLANDDLLLLWDQSGGAGAVASLNTLASYVESTLTIPAAETGTSIVSKLVALTGNAQLPATAIRGLPTGITNAQASKLAGIEAGATGDQSGIEIAALLNNLSGATRVRYDAIANTPTIPAAQVPADWNASSGVSRILNKPTIPSAETGATIVSKLQALTGNARLDASAIRNLPTGGGGSSPTLTHANISFNTYTIGRTISANDIFTYTVPNTVAPSATVDSLCIVHFDFSIQVLQPSGVNFTGVNRVVADFTLVHKRGTVETLLAREKQYVRMRQTDLFNGGSLGIDADVNLRTGDQLILRDRSQGETNQRIQLDTTDAPRRLSIVSF